MQAWSGVHSTLCVLGKAETGSGAATGTCVAHTEQTQVCGTRAAEKQQLGAEGCSPGLALSLCTVCSCLARKTPRSGEGWQGQVQVAERGGEAEGFVLPPAPFFVVQRQPGWAGCKEGDSTSRLLWCPLLWSAAHTLRGTGSCRHKGSS